MALPKQIDFYNQQIRHVKEQLVVIISDALRYEVGVSLLEKLQADEKCTVELKPMLGVLPSITPVSYTHLDVYKRQPHLSVMMKMP